MELFERLIFLHAVMLEMAYSGAQDKEAYGEFRKGKRGSSVLIKDKAVHAKVQKLERRILDEVTFFEDWMEEHRDINFKEAEDEN